MKIAFDAEWEGWIVPNLERGCNPEELFRILLKHDYDYGLCRDRLGMELPEYDLREHAFPPSRSQGPYLGGHFISIPFAQRLEVDECELFRLPDFLNRDECEQLITLSEPLLKPSTVVAYTPDVDPLFRTSLTAELSTDHPFVAEIDRRLCAIMGLNPTYSEGIQIQIYHVGAEFKAHHDYFSPGTQEYDIHAGPRGQRTWTVMVYLNDTPRGGETHFPEVDVTAYPCAGTAVIWNNLFDDGHPNPASKHHGMPVLEGTKAIITKWFRSRGQGPAFQRTRNEYLTPLTREAFRQERMPPGLLRALREYISPLLPMLTGEGEQVQWVGMPEALQQRLLGELRGLGEMWSGVELEPLEVEGITVYRAGATLDLHRGRFPLDGIGTQQVAAIIPISVDCDEPWRLRVEDHVYRRHELELVLGQLLWLEEGRSLHGMPNGLSGNHVALAIVHFQAEVQDVFKEIVEP